MSDVSSDVCSSDLITSGDRYSRSAAKGVGDFRRQFDSYHTVEDRRKVDGFHGLIPPVTLLQATRRVRAGMRTSGTAPPPMLKPLTSRAGCSASEARLRSAALLCSPMVAFYCLLRSMSPTALFPCCALAA